RRQRDSEFVEAIVNVLAESPSPHFSLERHIRGGDDPRGNANWLIAAERLHLSVLESTQERSLRRKGNVGDLVEEQRTAVRALEVPFLSLMRSRERALLIPEEFGFDERIGDRAAIDRHKRLRAPGAHVMDRASDEFLSCARLTFDEDRERRVGHLADLLDNLLHLRAGADQQRYRAVDDVVGLPQLTRAFLDGDLELVDMPLKSQLLLLGPAAQRA